MSPSANLPAHPPGAPPLTERQLDQIALALHEGGDCPAPPRRLSDAEWQAVTARLHGLRPRDYAEGAHA